jgi:hypothetical protein
MDTQERNYGFPCGRRFTSSPFRQPIPAHREIGQHPLERQQALRVRLLQHQHAWVQFVCAQVPVPLGGNEAWNDFLQSTYGNGLQVAVWFTNENRVSFLGPLVVSVERSLRQTRLTPHLTPKGIRLTRNDIRNLEPTA